MKKKKRELIDILLDNITPDDWPEGLPYAAQDKLTLRVFFYSKEPKKLGSNICRLRENYITVLSTASLASNGTKQLCIVMSL